MVHGLLKSYSVSVLYRVIYVIKQITWTIGRILEQLKLMVV